ESGKIFAVPTYFFIATMVVLLGYGFFRMSHGGLPVDTPHEGQAFGHGGSGLLYGASLFLVLRAFASGGAAVTGVEAISNGVSAFRVPEWKNARGVFSTGITMLALAATVLMVITGANVSRLIPLYAIGVFTSFTLSQAGMAKHHITHKQVGWRRGLVVNSIGAVMSAIVDVIIALTKFKPPGGILGAWVIVIAVPIIVYLLARTNK